MSKKDKAKEIYKNSLKLHKFYKGKIGVVPKCPVRSLEDFNYWYSPGVAAACVEISKNPDKVFEYTNRWNTIAVVSDGSRVLGLGDIGPKAALPVMEGKSLIFKYLGGVDAFPIVINTKDPDEIINVVKNISSSFGGINLEDIEQPKCFYILDRLREELDIPVWHDDQQGTATVTVAGLINALKVVGKKISEIKVALVGAGAANVRIAKLLIKAGVLPEEMVVVDSKGILNMSRKDIEEKKDQFKEKWELCLITNKRQISGSIEEALVGCDVVISASRPGPGVIKKEWIKKMAKDPIVFAEANPVPEILPEEAKQAGAKIVATGRSDYPNQINNSLCFPGIFRGVLDVQARTITDEMCVAVAYTIAKFAEKKGITEDYIVPTMEEWEVYPEIAVTAAAEAIKQKVARKKISKEKLYKQAKDIINSSIQLTKLLMDKKFIKLIFLCLGLFSFFNFGYSKGIVRYKYFVESARLDGSCGKIYSINSYVVKKNKVLLGLHRFDLSFNYGATSNAEVGIKFNLNDQQDVVNFFSKNIKLISPYAKYKLISSTDGNPVDMALGFYKTSVFVVLEKTFPEFYSTSLLVNFFLTFLERQKFSYSFSFSKYTKWVEFILDLNPIAQYYAVGARALLTPDIRLNLFLVDIKNLKNVLFYNFVFGICLKI